MGFKVFRLVNRINSYTAMENQKLNENQKISEKDKSATSDPSNIKTSQNSDIETNPGGAPWPKDETLEEFLEKDKSNSKMKPGSLDKQ